ncbi:DNA-3-methyladenine glycosylase 2 [Synoicihabitans lomoniglobus]|uniref:DNA-(apurinic or apyrimidinic site) lyase n=1 Tax=Synoicihabitans lomoniglobus TaxID=2909285 RepID=A0AAE9ZX72_9BACT|nr:DNA-binding protein [Opitutaceae bacterium LMO-M01]WED64754.1 DNA glycosylase [Opitutaceae bacterium LMO-M01]
MSDPGWTPWTPLDGAPTFPPAVLAEQLDGGQAFRWHRQPDDSWQGQWSTHLARLRLAPGRAGSPSPPLQSPQPTDSKAASSPTAPPSTPLTSPQHLEWSAPIATAPTTEPALRHYLACDDTTAAILPTASDPHLATCVAAYPGLRILRQPFGETLLGFLCSATKQIVQIKQMIALLAERHGAPLPPAACHLLGDKLPRALPTWAQLATVTEADLRACQLGFRARYIKGTADMLAAEPDWLATTAQLPFTAAKTRLLSLPGVGEKIADCVLLFGLGHHAAFPVDTWMIKAMTRRYGLDGWSPAQVAHFGRVHYGPAAGLAQQYLFAWERTHGAK